MLELEEMPSASYSKQSWEIRNQSMALENFGLHLHDKKDAERYQLKVDSYPILLLNTETINYTKTNDKPLRNGEKHLIAGEITTQFKKYGITVYWGGQVPKYSIFSPRSISPDETYTEVDITPK